MSQKLEQLLSSLSNKRNKTASIPSSGKPRVCILSAWGLREADWVGWGQSERYCTCEVPGKPQSRSETPAVDDRQDAVWNHEFEVSEYLDGDLLSFDVMATHRDWKTWRACLGRATLPSHCFRSGFDGEVRLVEAGKGVRAYLRLRVQAPDSPQKMPVKDEPSGPDDAPVTQKTDPLAVTLNKVCEASTDPAADEWLKWQTELERRAKHWQSEQERRAVQKRLHDKRMECMASQKATEEAPLPVAVPEVLEDCLAMASSGRDGRIKAATSGSSVVKSEKDLPEGWQVAWSDEHNRYYYFNLELDTSSWEWPEK